MSTALAMPAPELLAELDAGLHAVCTSLQGLLGLLGDDPGPRAVPADGLRHLLLPMADQLDQAAAAAVLLLAAQAQHRPPAD